MSAAAIVSVTAAVVVAAASMAVVGLAWAQAADTRRQLRGRGECAA